MNALQDAVPEDVRGKLTSAVSEILHNQGTNLKLDGLLNISRTPNVASGLKSKIQEKGGLSSAGGPEDAHSSDPRDRVDELANNSNDNQVSVERSAGGLEPELQVSETQSTAHGDNFSSSMKKDPIEQEKYHENVHISRAAQYAAHNENGSDTGAKPEFSSQSASAGGTEDVTSDQHKADQNGGLAKVDVKEGDNIQQNVEKVANSSTDQNKTMSLKAEEGLPHPVSPSEPQTIEREGSDGLKKDEKSVPSILNQNSSDSPTFSVSQALDALTGIDDSTQVAVNSVFGVIENMITQLEVEKDTETKFNDKKEDEDRAGYPSDNHQVSNDYKSMEEDNKGNLSSDSDIVDISSNDETKAHNDARTRQTEEERPIPIKRNSSVSSWENDMGSHAKEEENGPMEHLVNRKLLAVHSNKVRRLCNFPLYITTNPYGDSLYKEYLRKYLLSKMSNVKPLDLDTTASLFLDYIPEEGQWKLLELPENNEDSAKHEGTDKDIQAHSPSKAVTDEVIEPPYVIMDVEKQLEPVQEYDTLDGTNQKDVISNNDSLEELMSIVKNVMLDSLKVEVDRRLSSTNSNEREPNLAREMEDVANAVSLAAGHSKDHIWFLDGKDCNSEKLGALNGEQIINAISLAIQETSYLRRLLPVGVVVGSSLAALRKFFDVAAINGRDRKSVV